MLKLFLELEFIQVETLTSSGPLSVPSIQATTLSAEDFSVPPLLPSVPPPSFYRLTSPRSEESDPPVDDIHGLIPRNERNLTQMAERGASPDASRPEADDDILDLGTRLGRSLIRSGMRAINAMMEFLENVIPMDPESEQKQRTHLQVMLCVLLLLVTGIFLLTRSTTTHPHWDFYLPPTDL
jgi:hypothetical protein